MNEHTLLYKNISRTLYSRKDVGCVCEMGWRWGQTLILTQSSSRNHRSTSSSSWLGLLNRGSLRSASWFSRWHPISNWLKPSVPRLYYCLTFTCFRCSSAYLHRCISWLTTQSRVNMIHFFNYIFSSVGIEKSGMFFLYSP